MTKVVEDQDSWVRSIEEIEPGRVNVVVVKPDGNTANVEMSTRPIPASRPSADTNNGRRKRFPWFKRT